MTDTKLAGITVLAVSVMLLVTACRRSHVERKDVLMDAVANLEDVYDTPLSQGRVIYSKYCSVCHGAEGKGDGFNAFNLNPRPRDVTDSSFVARLDSSLIVETIAKGGRGVGLSRLMPPWNHTLKETDIGKVAGYIVFLANHSKVEESH